MRTRLSRYFVTYRWELWLIIGIPAVSGVAFSVSFPLIAFLLVDIVGFTAIDDAGRLASGIVGLLLLSVSYLRVRRLERDFLPSLWGYSIAVAVIGIVTTIAALVVAVADFEVSRTVSSLHVTVIRLFGSLLQYLALLWFARQLSRISLTHAFFLVAFTSLYLFIPIQGSLIGGTSSEIGWATFLQGLIGGFVGLIVMLIKVWLLGNFDRRGERFRKEAIIILVATVILSDYARVALGTLLDYLEIPSEAILPLLGSTVGLFMVMGLVVNLMTLLVLFGSVYLVRVRQPKTLDATPVPASNC